MKRNINIESTNKADFFNEILDNPKYNYFEVLSEDELDLNERIQIPIKDITDIDEDFEGKLTIWWRMYNPLEGSWMDCSNQFSVYLYY